MSMNSWEQAEEWYKLALDSRYSDTARGMLKLLPLLRQERDFEVFEFGMSLLAFFYVLPQNGRWLFVQWKMQDTYTIFLDRCSNDRNSPDFYGEKIEIPTDQVISTLKTYLEKFNH
jgi:hypothetical protein